jgi:hypothetical protein
MTITIYSTPRFGWCIEIDNGPEWILHLRLPSEADARAYVTQEYPGVTPTVEQPAQPTLFPSTDATERMPLKRRKKESVGG